MSAAEPDARDLNSPPPNFQLLGCAGLWLTKPGSKSQISQGAPLKHNLLHVQGIQQQTHIPPYTRTMHLHNGQQIMWKNTPKNDAKPTGNKNVTMY